MWYMCVLEMRKELIVSDMMDGIQHVVDVYDFEGNYLRRISRGHKDVQYSEGHVCWPRGVATDGLEQFLYVLNEYYCLQSFRIANGQFVDLLNLVPPQEAVSEYPQGAKALLVLHKGHTLDNTGSSTLYVVGWKCFPIPDDFNIFKERPILWVIKLV